MTTARDELRRLVEELPDDRVPAALLELRRLLASPSASAWPPPWFGAIATARSDISEHIDDALTDGFGG